jgi:uncharacterized protein HemY
MSRAARKEPPLGVPRSSLSAKWLLVPLSVLALIVLVPLFLVVRSLIASRRATRRYAQDLARYRSTSSPS